MRFIIILSILSYSAVASLVACDDGSGCKSDNDCKGERICVDSECVDRDEAKDSGGSSGSEETGGKGGSGGSGEKAGTSGSAGDGGAGGSTQPESGTGGDNGESGTGGDNGGSGGGGGGFDPADEALEAACIADCEAMRLPECDEYVVSLDQCMASCLMLDATLDGYCFKEYENLYTCKADGGYECLNNRPIPHASCTEEQSILNECRAEIPCRNYCETAIEEGCAEDDASCFEECETEKTRLERSASSDYDRLLSCWTQSLICENGYPTVSGCEDEIAETAWHIGIYDDDCSGYCWAADILGCGSDECENICQTKMSDSSCGSRYRSLLSCVISLSSLNMICTDEGPEPSGSCIDDQANYDSCLETSTN